MDKAGMRLLEELIMCPSPTGFEQALQGLLFDKARKFVDVLEPDSHGNLAMVINPGAPRRVMLAAHCDQIGFMVMEIDEKGFLRVDELGGIDVQSVIGERVIVHTAEGDIPGTFGKTAVHNQKMEDREKTPKLEDLWIDIGAKDHEEAAGLVRFGDPVTFEPRIMTLLGDRLAAPRLDNAAGLWVLLEVARRAAEDNLDVALYCVSTVQEEIGSRGAETASNRIEPQVAIAIDTTLAVDDPGTPKKKTAPRIKLGEGPTISRGPNTNPVVRRMLEQAAGAWQLPWQTEANPQEESNDAKPLQLSDGGAATASVGIPIRNMHTQSEVMDLNDMEAAAKLLTEFVTTIRNDTNLLPLSEERLEIRTGPTPGRAAESGSDTRDRRGPRHQEESGAGRSQRKPKDNAGRS